MKIGDIYLFKKKGKEKIEVINMFELFKKKRTELKPESPEEKLAFLRAKNIHAESKLKTFKGIQSEEKKGKELKKEVFKQTTAGKVLSAVGNLKEQFKPPKKGKGGGFGISINQDYVKKWG